MMVKHYRELIAWQLADQFRTEVYRLLQSSPEARANLKLRGQLTDAIESAVANIAEGFRRFSPRVFAVFLDYSLASLGEAEERLHGGIKAGYWTADDCTAAFTLARRCLTASIRLKHSQHRIRPRTPQRRPARRDPS